MQLVSISICCIKADKSYASSTLCKITPHAFVAAIVRPDNSFSCGAETTHNNAGLPPRSFIPSRTPALHTVLGEQLFSTKIRVQP